MFRLFSLTPCTHLQPHFLQNGVPPPRGMPFKVPGMSAPSQLHIQSDEPILPPGTPDTPHGEIHHMNEQDFTTPGGVYGAIGSSMTTSTGVGLGGANSFLSRSLPSSSMGMGLSYSNSPLSSPRLPHPPPPLNMKVRPSSDIWVPHFGSGPRMTAHHHMPQVVPPHPGPSFGLPPSSFPPLPPPQQQQHNHIQHHHHHQHQPTASYPHVLPHGGHKPPADPHMIPRVTMGDHQHHSDAVGGIFVPNMGIRHSFGGDDYRIGNVNGVPPVHHKRWSVPSFSHVPQPAVSTHFSSYPMQRSQGDQPHVPPPPPPPGVGGGVWSKPSSSSLPSMETRSLGGGGPSVNGLPSGFDQGLPNNMYGQGGGGILSLSDPWASHWAAPSGGPGFSSPPPLSQTNGPVHSSGSRSDVGRGKGSSNVSDPSWTSSVASGGSEEELEGNSPSASDMGTELFQLMKSLDINSEHMQSLKVWCTCFTTVVI